MQPEFLNIVMMPLNFVASLILENPFRFSEAFILLIILSAAYRYILAPIIGYNLGEAGSDYVARKKYERNMRIRKGG